jgi:endonuclease YncB( thermonuclease family)
MPMVNGTRKVGPPPTFERTIVCFYRKPLCKQMKCNSSLTKPPSQARKGSIALPLSMSILQASLTALACFGPIDWSIASDLKFEGTVFGAARVVDGDTLVVNGVRIRLYGIDAPEKKQLCQVSGNDVACGMKSAQALKREIGGRPVACSLHGRDLYGRGIGVCSVESKPGVITDLNSWMVDKGHAVAYRKYSLRYVQQELSAQKSKLGIWAGSFELPEDWRREHLHRKNFK